MPRLKVYRTAIGFHDAYVAAPSQKAALEAWGASNNLFAIGGAEVVTDPELTAEPLANPGTVIKRSRGSLRDHLSAAGQSAGQSAGKRAAGSKPRRGAAPAKAPRPRPDRKGLDEAEAALQAAQREAEAELAEMARREAELRRERERLEARHRRAIAKCEQQVERARTRYERALERWRAAD
jgi:hypothetical protein